VLGQGHAVHYNGVLCYAGLYCEVCCAEVLCCGGCCVVLYGCCVMCAVVKDKKVAFLPTTSIVFYHVPLAEHRYTDDKLKS